MAHIYRAVGRRCLRLAALVCCSVGLAAAALGMTRVDVFQATVPLTNGSEASRAAAFEAALKVVLMRATGSRAAPDEAVFAPLVSNARRYVQQYRSAPDNQLTVAFDGAAIERWLAQNDEPLWGRERPSTLVWLTVPVAALSSSAAPGSAGVPGAAATQGTRAAPGTAATSGPAATVGTRTAPGTAATPGTAGSPGPGLSNLGASQGPMVVVSSEDTSELKTAIDAAAAQRGIPLIWPAPDTASGTVAVANPVDVGRRLGAEGVLIGRASSATLGAPVRWTLMFQDRSSDFIGPLDGVEHAADLYAGIYAASGSLAPVDVDVGGLADLADYAAAQAYLESLNFVAHVSVESLTGDTVRFRLSTRGGIETLQHAIALDGRLQSVPAGGDGIQRFELRR